MKIIVLHWHGICPHCGNLSCIYASFRREHGVKLHEGYECESCNMWISDDEFDQMEELEVPCLKESLK